MQPTADILPASAEVTAFQRDGAVCLRGCFADWVETLRAGVARNEAEPGPHAEDAAGGEGRFFGDYCNWQRIPEYATFVRTSRLAPIAAALMRSKTARMFHEHVLIKEPGTAKRTPWHHDLPYYNVQGKQTVSLWIALDPVDAETAPEFVAGSHLWGKLFYPQRFLTGQAYDYEGSAYLPIPNIEAERAAHRILSWPLQPGDAVAFSFLTLHAAPANRSTRRRRAFSARLLGDDARYATRPGETSPPQNRLGLADGAELDEANFPTVWPS